MPMPHRHGVPKIATKEGQEKGQERETSSDAPGSQANQACSHRSKLRQMKRLIKKQEREKDQQEQQEAAEALQKKTQAAVEQIMGCYTGASAFKLHCLTKRLDRVVELSLLEQERHAPLSADDPKFKNLGLSSIHEVGLHIGVNEKWEIVFVIRITPFSEMDDAAFTRISSAAQTLMDWSRTVAVIKINGSQKEDQCGKMYGVGWHASMEKGTTLVYYAPLPGMVAEYERCAKELPDVVNLYRERMGSMFPAAMQEISQYTEKKKVPSFGDADMTFHELPFAHSLTLTKDDFANRLHNDNDQSRFAYGIWWPATLDPMTSRFRLTRDSSHSSIKGGSFLIADYGVFVNFEETQSSLVEIEWRGKDDKHCTMQSLSLPGFTRFGTSVQITKKGAAAVGKFWENKASRAKLTIITDRIENAHRQNRRQKRQRDPPSSAG